MPNSVTINGNNHDINNSNLDLLAKNITINDTIFRIQVWDTAGQENFVSMTKVYYRNSSVKFYTCNICLKQ